tara:strand:+ start:2712 stop:2828 length:117 start_codon:yes stop_codon:yes gene_type:complete
MGVFKPSVKYLGVTKGIRKPKIADLSKKVILLQKKRQM